ncbi:PIN-like domain-containing protein [Delftia lacustris]|uniref:PIN-like domain-containing protein n=1 Tax=Delftia lacustris TaxID=558537 RepID=UPI0035A72F17
MLFGQYVIDKTIEEYVKEIADLASDPKTLIFIDTNIVAYLYKLHEAARREFFAWSDRIAAEGRLVIPAWAANEYLSRVTSNSLASYTPKGKEPTQAKKMLETLHETASLFVDEVSLRGIGYENGREAFLKEFRQAIETLNRFTSVFSQQFDPGVIHQQVVTHLSPFVLNSNLAALCARAMQEASGRIEHRLPPGFRDDGKPENRLGDLIIWYELLEKSAADSGVFPKVLFISRDEKSDWVYAPAQRNRIAGKIRKTTPNIEPQIKLADPRLVAEFTHNTGHGNFTIANLPTLVEGLSRRSSSEFQNLAAAIQISIQETASISARNDQETSTPAEGSTNEGLETAVEAPPAETPVIEEHAHVQGELVEPDPPRLQYSIEALQDSHYPADAPSEINSIIRDFRSYNWYKQNPAVIRISTIREEPFTPSAWFVLGRNLYQAACGNSQRAMNFIDNLEAKLRQFPEETAKHLLAGMLYEIYFDGSGQFRNKAKFSYADKPLAVVAEEIYADVREFICTQLRQYREKLMFLPGEKNGKVIRIVAVTGAPADVDEPHPTHKLLSVTLDGIELMSDKVEAQKYSWPYFFLGPKISPDRIREIISEALAIPKWALTIETQPEIKNDLGIDFPEDRDLRPTQALLGQ